MQTESPSHIPTCFIYIISYRYSPLQSLSQLRAGEDIKKSRNRHLITIILVALPVAPCCVNRRMWNQLCVRVPIKKEERSQDESVEGQPEPESWWVFPPKQAPWKRLSPARTTGPNLLRRWAQVDQRLACPTSHHLTYRRLTRLKVSQSQTASLWATSSRAS